MEDSQKTGSQLIHGVGEMCKRIAGPEKLEIVPKQAKDPYEAEALIKNTSAEISGQRPVEEILKNNEARYRSVFNGSKNAIAVYEAVAGGEDFICADFNRTWERVEGINKGDLIGRRVTEVFLGVKDMGLFEGLRRVGRSGEPEELPVSFYKDDRIAGWKENYVYKLPSGEVVVIYDDVTERKRAEEVLRRSEEESKRLAHENSIVAEIGRIISSTLNIEEVYKPFSEKVKELIPFDRIGIILNNSEHNTHTIPYVEGVVVSGRQPGDVVPLTGMPVEKVGRTRKGLLLKMDSEEEIMAEFPGLLPDFRSGMRSGLTVPLISRNQVIGGLALRSKTSGAYSDRDLRLAENIGNQIAGGIANAQLYSERKKADEKMSALHRFQNEMLDTDAIWIDTLDPQGNITFWNRAAECISGYSRQEVLGNNEIWGKLYPDPNYRAQVSQRAIGVIQQGKRSQNFETVIRRKDGELRVISWCSSSLTDQEGKAIATIVLGADVTERKQSEEKMASLQDQLRQSQKMEAIGCLAGGIAHDFNNLLTVIKGYSQISLDELKEGDPLIENLKEIWAAGNRASDLTRQLLAFSRRQVLEFKVVDLNKLIGGMEKMLGRILGEDIEPLIRGSEDLGRIKIDPGQMEQVIMNLAVNSREAMPSGGKLILETDNVYLDDEYARNHISVKPGRYVRFSVSDTGRGMTPEVKDRVFEPFFTTKGKEKGTGLGLSTVYGIVKQSDGNIWVYSEPGKGTTFKIYLPRVDEPVPIEKSEKKRQEAIPHGSETVLVVEDEEVVRRLAVRILKKQGYKVLEAPNSGEAFLVCENYKEPIDLILTDVVMPRMGGPELIGRLRQIRQDFKVVYMSGYTDEAVVFHGVREGEMAFIQKPFNFEDLARKVREVLDR